MSTINELKQQAITATPLFLFDCKLAPGTVERWSTHGVTVDGQQYKARVLQHNLFELRASSDEGLDSVAKIALTLANADSYFSEIQQNVGWKGAQITVRFVFYDLASNAPASESRVIFQGVANSPDEIREATLRLSFTNRLNLQRVLLPEVRIEKRCPWAFPSTAEQRQESLNGGERAKYSPLYRCGYSADQQGGVGNMNSGSPYAGCDFTRVQCEQRGMFDKDSAGNVTRRFGGIEFVPASVLVRSYGEKGSHVSPVLDNEARYSDFVPVVYGTAWYQPPIVFARNDGNLTRMEVLLGMGEIAGVVKVIVNDIEIPEGQAGADMTATGWFSLVTPGTRSGTFNPDFADAMGNPVGDPYGSMALLSVVAPNRISNGQSLARIQVLLQGLKLPRYAADGTDLGEVFTNNPAWVLLDVLRRSGWSLAELELGSFAATAQYCDELIQVTDLNGNPASAPRFQCNLVLRKRRSAADVVRGIRNGSALYLTYGSGGLLQLRPESTLALQQPGKPDGSNSERPLNGGWPAYEFSDASATFSGLLRKDNGEPSVRIWSRTTAETPNQYTVEFQDEFNEYQQDSLSLVDMDDALLTGQELSATLTALGLPNFDQAARMIRLQLNKSLQGNTFIDFETTVRGIGLTPGDLITVTYLKEGYERQPFRVVRIAPGRNHETMSITGQWHDDNWYTGGDISSASRRRQRGAELGLPRPLVGAVVDSNGADQFGIAETAIENSDGSSTVKLSVAFIAPDKPSATSVGIPLLSLSPVVSTTGGSLGGNQALYYAISAVDGSGGESPLSFAVRASLPGDTNTNTVTLTNLSFSADTATFHVYRGPNPMELLRVAANVAVANQFVDTGAAKELKGPPDENFDHANFYWRLERQPEQTVDVHSAVTAGNCTLQMLPNDFRGMTVRISKGKGAGQERNILANTATTLTITPKWDVEPDTTSGFVVAESTWHFGALGSSSPIEVDIPNRKNATVQISGRSANVHDQESAYDLAPLTRWRIGGAGGTAIDGDVPAAPIFGLFPAGQGTIELLGIGFADLTNTRTISAGTLTLCYWDELSTPSQKSVANPIGASDASVDLATAGSAQAGDLIQIDAEVMLVQESQNGGTRYSVIRGSHGSIAAAHDAGAAIYHLQKKVSIMPFVRDFFGSPASGSYSYPIFTPDVRVAAAELFVTNSVGNSDTARISFTNTAEGGLRTLSGGQISIQVEGGLAIQTDAAPPFVIDEARAVRDVSAVVRQAPVGGEIQLQIRQNDVVYCQLTIPENETSPEAPVSGFGMVPLEAKAQLSLDILSVPQGDNSVPGSDLTVTIRL